DIPFEAVRAQIASWVNRTVHRARRPDGRRKIAQIAEVVGYDANGAILRDIFLLGMGSDLRLEYNATGYVPTSLDKAAFYGVQVDQDLFDPVKSRFVPAGSDSMMPVVKDPLMAGARGAGGEDVVRQVVVVPLRSGRPSDCRLVAAQASMAAGQQAAPGPQFGPSSAEHAAAASQALQAATAMARATSALGQMAAAATSGFAGMLPITHTSGPMGTGATRRIQAVVESLITRKGL